MPPLPSDLRRVLENAVVAAREEATIAAGAALKRLAVEARDFPPYLTPDERSLRLKLRAAARQLGDPWNAGSQAFATVNRLTHEVAYEHWHRMLFARFLAENNLLVHPEHNVPVDLPTVAELAQEQAAKSGTKADTWAMAGRFAAAMLPQIFRPPPHDDPALAVLLAPEHQQALEKILESLPPSVFTADDSLGWVYQFWQSAEKDRVNAGVKGGDKITGETLPAVTQLFTEHYMVLFLLHNTIGAWHAAKQLAKSPKGQQAQWQSEADCRAAVALPGYAFDYLRFVKDDSTGAWRPAAGGFEGWPRAAKDLKVLDPCCGSGHFLVATLELLTRLRMAEEGLSPRAAAAAVIEDNLFGLELDARCTQIAAFNVALAAWKLADGHAALPGMHIACSGLGPSASLEQWLKLADKNSKAWAGPPAIPTHARQSVTNGLTNLHRLFSRAPELGSLIEPSQLGAGGELFSADWETLQPFLAAALASEKDDDARERAVAAQGMAKAAEILAGEYTLVITNVPYLGRGGQGEAIKAFCEKEYPEAKADLATVFVQRMLKWAGVGGSIATVTPQNWLFLTSYKKLRERLLKERTWNMVARLGPGAFETIGGHVVNVALITISGGPPAKTPPAIMAGIDASAAKSPADKAAVLRGEAVIPAAQRAESATGQPARATVQADGTSVQPDGTAVRADGAAIQATATIVQASRTTVQPTRTPADVFHGAPARGEAGAPGVAHAGPGAAHAGRDTAHGGPAAVPARAGAAHSQAGMLASPPPPPPAPSATPAEAERPPAEGDEPAAEDAPQAAPADGTIKLVPQTEQLKNPDATIMLARASQSPLLREVAHTYQGIGTADAGFYIVKFWEVARCSHPWALYQMAPESRELVSGCHSVLRWEAGKGVLCNSPQARVCGQPAWGVQGVAIGVTAGLPRGKFLAGLFDCTLAAMIPDKSEHLAALSAFVLDDGFGAEVRKVDQALSVTESSFGKVPFDLAHWQKVAAEKYPNGLPEPQSDDPTQWLFHGHPAGRVPLTTDPNACAGSVLQVAVARLVGYRWPAELDPAMRLAPEARAWVEKCKDLQSHADDDGVVPLVPINKEQPGAERVRALLEAAFGARWTPGVLSDLLAAAGSPGKGLDEWIKHEFFAQHCALFHQRPFVWQIWDGKKDGFNILVHYHRLAEGDGKGHRLLQKITYTYLGDWIGQQQAAAKRVGGGEAGADTRLKAAQDLQKKLEAILAGEPPYDIFVRWKPLHEQPIGWNPDINDGVRMNIRPFVTAGVLRGKVNVKWTKDRGKEPESIRPKAQFPWFWSCPEDEPPTDFMGGAKFTGERLNDLHYTRKCKEAAHDAEKGGA